MPQAASLTAPDDSRAPDTRTATGSLDASPAAPSGIDGDGDDQYLARRELDQAPAAQAAIDLPFPAAAPPGSYRAVLTLFIDASGQVQRVRSEGSGLPPSLEDAARQAFLAARFEPGVKDGQPVRSRIRVEVEYSLEVLPQRSASASAGAAGGESAP
jgi:TonB family protein